MYFSFGQNINEILNIKVGICATFTTKHGLNNMHPTVDTHQLGWFVGQGLDFHTCGSRIKPYD